ncbi:DUF1656 domain-containing protein [Gallaecimonas mangrovi]|uniref:DUF1656 domain-containing protein n=1 Tax=Gallaecimonas mangrovi TaxID=2291597 RepID=UPI000E2031E6|nr:DUF1656 domain-containing protein [Gallaecimonas mangrovi]
MLHEMALGGLLFSPFVVFAFMGFVMTLATRLVLHKLALRRWIWKEAWFDVSLFICYLALSIFLLGE